MIPDLYEYLSSFKEVGGDMKQRLQDVGLQDVFESLIKDELFTDGEKFNPTLFYILDCYSLNSKKHIGGAEWLVVKHTVAKATGLPKELYDAVVELKNTAVVQTIGAWLEYQNAPLFSQLCNKKDLRQQMLRASVSDLYKPGKTLVIDYEQKDKCSQKAARLLGEITATEDKMRASTISTIGMIKEFEEKSGMNTGMGLSPETNSEIA